MSLNPRFLFVLVFSVVFGSPVFAQERMVVRRSGIPPLKAKRIEVTTEGVRVFGSSDGLTQEQVIAWDRVASIDPMRNGAMEAGLQKRLKLGEELWRGRTRLNRGDARLALEEFQKAWSSLQNEQSELAALAAEGFVRASLARQQQHDAIVAGLAVAALKAKGYTSDRFAGLKPILDQETGLLPELPPVLDETRAAEAAEAIEAWSTSAQPEDRIRAELMRNLLLRNSPESAENPRNANEGITFLSRLVELDSTDPKRRERSRGRLLRSLDSVPTWREAWMHFFVGRSLVQRETDPALRQIGVLELLNVPPLGQAAPAGLTARSLRLAAKTTRELGDSRNANILDSLAESADSNDALEKTP